MNLHRMIMTETLRIHSIELASVEGIQTMRDRATDPTLKKAFDGEVRKTMARVDNLEDSLRSKDWRTCSIESYALEGVKHDMRETLAGEKSGPLLDVSLACLGRKLAHLWMVSYETALDLSAGDRDLTRTFVKGAEEARRLDGDMEWLLRGNLVITARREDRESQGRA